MSLFRKSAKKSDAILTLLVNLYESKTNKEIIISDAEESAESIHNFLDFISKEIIDPIINYYFEHAFFDDMEKEIKEVVEKLSHEKIYKDEPEKITRMYYGVNSSGTLLNNLEIDSLQKITSNTNTFENDWDESAFKAWKNAGFDKILLNGTEPTETLGSSGYVLYKDLRGSDIKLNLGNISKNLKLGLEKIYRVLKKLAEKYDNKSYKSLSFHSFFDKHKTTQYELDDIDDFFDAPERNISTTTLNVDSHQEILKIKQSITNATKIWSKNYDNLENISDDVVVSDNVDEGIVHSFYFFDEQNKLHLGPPNLTKDPEFKEFLKDAFKYL